ncbi:hypothetical protein PSHT_07243 [Puccinia striiformis]|uniref:DNA 3'-5' helicase n=1 Tax=Puccinia striiformis TaxID=27350 RepID=A0A2S4VZD7_9BASI|nr:hypothetical protein PSHT_07243 [Puccinia striiformis]
MITRSQTNPAVEVEGEAEVTPPKSSRLQLDRSIIEMNVTKLYNFVKAEAEKLFPEVPKELQIECCMSLVKQQHSFVLAGTGYGKSRIAEMYYRLFPVESKAIVLVLNPLDTLGDNQVEEKKKVGISAVNLTKMNMTPTLEMEIMRGDYAFIYLKAHMVYVWGLVASGKSKKLFSHARHQDRAVFRPSYGELGARLLATNGIPLLLLSATCRPQAIAAILISLKITSEYMHFFYGELTRPEITIWRIPMKASLKSCNDLLQLFGPATIIPNDELVPTLIYSTTRHLTMQVLTVLNRARRTPRGQNDPFSTLARRYHSCTGELDKLDIVAEFVEKVFPVISCTMALGLGQNWKRVRRVVHVGRGDPASIFQMIGRCGRGGDKGLAIMFVEETRKGGKNCVDDFTKPYDQTDDDWMDALAFTPVCLRVAFSIDNQSVRSHCRKKFRQTTNITIPHRLGYVPLFLDDPNYLRERKREEDEGLDKCYCSNCDVVRFEACRDKIIHATINNFDELLDHPENILADPLNVPFELPGSIGEWNPGSTLDPLVPVLESFAKTILADFEIMFAEMFDASAHDFLPSRMFDIEMARRVALGFHKGLLLGKIEKLMEGESVPGHMDLLEAAWDKFHTTEMYSMYVHEVTTYDEVVTRRGLELRSAIMIAKQTKEDQKIADRLAIEQRKAARIAKKLTEETQKEERRVAQEEKREIARLADEEKARKKLLEDDEKARKKTLEDAADNKKRLRKKEDNDHLEYVKKTKHT